MDQSVTATFPISLVHFNANPSGVRIVTRNDRSWVIAPVVALAEKVLQCTNCVPGGEFISANEIQRSVASWNGRPVTIDHPTGNDGTLVTANADLSTFDRVRIGEIWNSKWDENRLKFDLWLDVNKMSTATHGPELLEKIQSGDEVVEISTGYIADRDETPGVFNGNSFMASHKNIVPDHLAILTEAEGACSVADGCGTPRLNSEETSNTLESDTGSEFVMNTESAGRSGTGHPQETAMNSRENLLRALIDSESVGLDQAALESLSDEQLKGLATASGIDCGCSDDNIANTVAVEAPAVSDSAIDTAEGVVEEEEELIPAAQPKLSDEDSAFLSALRELGTAEEIADAIAVGREAKANAKADKKASVARLVANEECTVSQQDLEAMPITALQALETAFMPNDFSGLAIRGSAMNASESAFMETIPVILGNARTDVQEA